LLVSGAWETLLLGTSNQKPTIESQRANLAKKQNPTKRPGSAKQTNKMTQVTEQPSASR
jgi:hypothetical protein